MSRRWSAIGPIVAVTVTVVVAVVAGPAAGRRGIGRAVAGVGDLAPVPAAIGLLAAVAAIVNRGLLNQSAHRATGLTTRLGEMTRTAGVGFAAQKVVKSAGLAGLTVFVRSGRRHGHAAGPVVAACLLSAVASFAALGVVLATAIGVLAATGRLTGWWIGAAVGFGVYATCVAAAVAVLFRSRRATERIWAAATHLSSRLSARLCVLFRRNGDRRRPSSLPDDLHAAIAGIAERPSDGWRVLAHAVASKLLGALILAASAAAAGLNIGPGTALVVYATVLAASMVSVVPGGVGVVEGSMAALLVAAGGTAGAAALTVALFRLLDLWLPVAAGAVMARGELRSSAVEPGALADPDDPHGDDPRGTALPVVPVTAPVTATLAPAA